jgi:hypothetical protein
MRGENHTPLREPSGRREPKTLRAAWPDDEPADRPREPADRAPAVFYAPPGTCQFCDRRRAAAASSMRRMREKGEG